MAPSLTCLWLSKLVCDCSKNDKQQKAREQRRWRGESAESVPPTGEAGKVFLFTFRNLWHSFHTSDYCPEMTSSSHKELKQHKIERGVGTPRPPPSGSAEHTTCPEVEETFSFSYYCNITLYKYFVYMFKSYIQKYYLCKRAELLKIIEMN